MFKVKLWCLFLFLALLNLTSPAGAFIVINEFLADPPAGLAGDANGDQTGSSSGDEFIELFNRGESAVDLSGWALSDNTKIRHVFQDGDVILPDNVFVVFGGGTPVFDEFSWQVASSGGLGLNNTGDSILLADAAGMGVDFVEYAQEANANQSLVRFPEGTPGAAFIQHASFPGGNSLPFSPGFMVASPPHSASVPEPLSILGLGWGMIFGLAFKHGFFTKYFFENF
ncbi:MAG TPA: PEP-CTERM sorting domain-containing protein [Candidatus Omnitrophota bacterium]|nr:PEP-CTERM sorting domain-containing protein [Candidatus Omnitrophota bacterium]HQO58668.1 PEP-CTERM sorting domain-containing protein [Candidatus Omnitrophota bacterium]